MAETSPVGPTRAAWVPASFGRILILVGGVIVAVSSWLSWGKKSLLGSAASAYKVPAKFVIDDTARKGGLNLGIVVLVLGVLILAAALVSGGRLAGVLIGIAAGVTAFLYVYQVHRLIVDHKFPLSLSRLVGVGPYVTVAGSALAVIGGAIEFIPRGFWSRLAAGEEEPEAQPMEQHQQAAE